MESQKSLKEDWFLWLLVLLAIGVTGGYYLLVPSSKSSDNSSQWLFEGVEPTSIGKIAKYRGDSPVLVMERQSKERWKLTRPDSVKLDQSAARGWLKDLVSVEVKRRFTASSGADYGIGEDSTRIEITQEDRRHSLYLGNKSPTGKGVYLRYGESKKAPVFLLSKSVRENIAPSLHDLRDKSLIDQKFSRLKSVSFRTGGDSLTYRKTGDGWIIRSDRVTLTDTDSQTLGDNLRTLVTATASSFYDTAVPSSFKPIKGRVDLHFKGSVRKIRIGGKKDGERLLQITGGPVLGSALDPFRIFSDLPQKPNSWPTVKRKEPSGLKKSGTPAKLQKLRRRMKKRPSGKP
ncbi:MAG: DUF4340 domain-containing protein [bacterium]